VIRVDRAAGPAPPAAWVSRAAEGTQAAIGDGAGHVVDDGVYGRADVRAALEAVFSHKCAYCESFTTATGPWDVEHFRPKGRVAESAGHPGYYWLAYTWENLYLSCLFCNQRRGDKPTTEETKPGPPKGKLDQFPLRNDATRALVPGTDLTAEDRLLLDPCLDDPETHLAVDATGRLVALGGSDMAATTIDVCNLDRRRLTIARRKAVRTALALIDSFHGPAVTLQESIQAVTDTLGHASQPYALAARSIASQPGAFGLSP